MAIIYFAQACRSASETDETKGWPRVHAIVGDLTAGPIKIGFTRSLYQRLLDISRFARCRVWLVGAFLGSRADERRMHKMFGHLRLANPPFSGGTTEWFHQSWELQNFIASLPRPPLTDIEFTQRSLKPRGRQPLRILQTASH